MSDSLSSTSSAVHLPNIAAPLSAIPVESSNASIVRATTPMRSELAAVALALRMAVTPGMMQTIRSLNSAARSQPNSDEIQLRKETLISSETCWPASVESSPAGQLLGNSPAVASTAKTVPCGHDYNRLVAEPNGVNNDRDKSEGITDESSHPVTRPGISSRVLAMAGIRFVEEGETERLVGFRTRGLAIPYYTLNGQTPLICNDRRKYCRIRVADPVGAKYLSPAKSGCQLYIPYDLVALLRPGSVLGVVEGEFKSLALMEAGFACVGVGGISSVAPRNEKGEPQLLPALADLIQTYRLTKLAFIGDSDTALIADFSREAVKLAKLSGIPVVLPRIPLNAPGKGPDDLREILGEKFPNIWQQILDEAEPVTAETRQTQLAVRLLRRETSALEKLDPDALEKARQRLVKLADALSGDPLACAEVEEIAAKSAGLPRATLRAAVRGIKAERTIVAGAAVAPAHGDNIIILPGGERSITASAEELFAIIAPTQTLFHRGGRVHEVANNPDGTRRLRPVMPVQFRSRVESYGRVVGWRSGADSEKVLKPIICPEETAHALLESVAAREILPNVATLSACPVLAQMDEGIVVLGPGWHSLGGGLFVTGGETPPRVPLHEAIQALKDALSDFDFATEGDFSRALAAFIAPGLRFGSWLSNPLPVDIGEADASQSGKTYRQKVVAAVYREIPNIVVQRVGGVGGLDESISQKLIDGRPFVLLDNYRGKLDSPYLESLLTAPGTMPARVPHRGEVQVDPRNFIFQITSNGAETTRDLANRASIVRIRKRPENYLFKVYSAGDLYAHVVANQPRYLGCVFAIIEEWASKGRQRTDENRHDFREWVRVLDWIARNIFNVAPLMDQHDEARQRIGDPRRVWLRSLCIAVRDAKYTGEYYATQLAEFAMENDMLPPNIKQDADESSVARCIGKIMAGAFGDTQLVEIDGFKISRDMRYSDAAQKKIAAYRFT